MIRILGIELRRSGALPVAVTLLVVSVALLYSARERWTSGYLILALDQRWYLPLLAALAIAAGAWQGRRDHRSGVTELFATVPRPRSQQVAPVLLVQGATLFVAYVAATITAALYILDTAHYFPAAAVLGVVATGALATLTAAWSGLAIGRLLPHAVTAPALAVAVFATPAIARDVTGNREWLSTLLFPAYGLGGGTDFDTFPTTLSLAQLLYLAGLATTAALLLATTRRRVPPTALIPATLGITTAVVILQAGAPFTPTPTDPTARELVCTPDTPTVCVARIHSGVLPEVTEPARAALARLSRLPNAPTRAVEHLDQNRTAIGQTPDTVLIPLTIDDSGHVNDADRLTGYMLENLGVMRFVCPEDSPGGPPEPLIAAATSWLLNSEPSPGDPETTAHWQQLHKLPEPAAAAQIANIRQAILTCTDIPGVRNN